ncbi:MAG: TolC family protein, partial [Endozoicomonas sp.]
LESYDGKQVIQRSAKAGLNRPGKTVMKISVLASAVFLAACSVKPVVISENEHQARITEDKTQMYADQEAITESLTLYQAMARAIRYNLDHRLKVMEEALASDMLEVSRLDMLPQLTYNAGYRGRNNYTGASSRSLLDGTESLVVSTSQEKERLVGDLGLSWNILDFGVSYYRAKQQADRLMIVAERRRKVIHNIIQDVRGAYWRAVTAQRVLSDIEPLMARMESALDAARKVEKRGLQAPEESLSYQRRLLTSMRQLHEARKELLTAKTELATLMSLPAGTQFSLAETRAGLPEIGQSVTEMEELALLQRPELREEGYHNRISATEIKRTMASLMPSLTLNTTYSHDSNRYNYHSSWFDTSAMISGNLMDIFTMPQRMDVARAQGEVVDTRRMALNMAVLSQVHISLINFAEASASYRTDNALDRVENRLLHHASSAASSNSGNELDVIEKEMNALLAELYKGESYAEMQTAYGQVYLSIGADPLPASIANYDINTLADALSSGEAGWAGK